MIEITELPIKTWTQTYKETVLEPLLDGHEGGGKGDKDKDKEKKAPLVV